MVYSGSQGNESADFVQKDDDASLYCENWLARNSIFICDGCEQKEDEGKKTRSRIRRKRRGK